MTNQPAHQSQDHQPQEGQTGAAGQLPASLSRRAIVLLVALVIGGLTAFGQFLALLFRVEPKPPVDADVRARFVEGPLPDDPTDPQWTAALPVGVTLLAQQMATPMLDEATISEMQLRVLHNGREIGFRLEWPDDTVNDLEAMGQFRDSVAVQLPVRGDGTTPVTMGGPGWPVHILHWKASWQRQLADGPRRVRDAFPYAVNKTTPEQLMGEEAARVVYPALYVGNIAAARERQSPVEELVAEGFGTLTTHDQQRATGNGLLANGRWQVVLRMPMAGDDGQPALQPASSTLLALAAWDGGHGQRGARKHWSNWLSLYLDGGR
jgi:DMSO reductase family type II enzyme heme b subunit